MAARLWLSILALCALVALEAPAEVHAQTRRARSSSSRSSSRGSTRRASRRSRRTSRRSRRRYRESSRGWYRYRRQRRVWVDTYGPDDCDYVEDGYCYYRERYYTGSSTFSFGFSLDVVGSVYATNVNGLSSARVLGQDLDAGVVPGFGGGFRAWILYDRLRVGGMYHAGAAFRTADPQLRDTDVFEEGSRLGGGWWWGAWAFAAYQPQLSDLVQLWFGARAGFHTVMLNVEVAGRAYDEVSRPFFSAGPEVGLMLSQEDGVGIMFWGFADLALPGHATVSIAFVYEAPKPEGAAF